jgi:hypothetical protein
MVFKLKFTEAIAHLDETAGNVETGDAEVEQPTNAGKKAFKHC